MKSDPKVNSNHSVEEQEISDEGQTQKKICDKLKAFFGHSIDAFFHISLKNRYLYVQNPKVASSTIKSKLIKIEIEGTNIKRSDIGLHPDVLRSVHVKPYQITDLLLEEILTSDHFIRFCFVRSPVSRVLSAFLDKIMRNEPEGIVFKNSIGISANEDISFADFVRTLYEARDNKLSWDPHWRPQFALLRPDLIRYNLIGKFEEFDANYERLNFLMKGRLGNYEVRAPHKTGASQKVHDFVSDVDLKLIHEIYKNDFKFFGYGFDF